MKDVLYKLRLRNEISLYKHKTPLQRIAVRYIVTYLLTNNI